MLINFFNYFFTQRYSFYFITKKINRMIELKAKRDVVICLLCTISAFSGAQTVVVDGEIRPRMEYRDGFSKPLLETNDPGVFAVQRTRLNLAFTTGDLSTYISFQDSRTFGQTPNASGDATTGIYEAWAEMLIAPGGSFKMGRQTLKYDDNRLFSAPAWSNTGTSHDVALFKYNINDFQGHIGLAYNNNAAISSETYYSPVSKYRYMGFVWLSKNIIKGLTLSAVGVDEGVQDTTVAGLKKYKKITMNHAYTFGGNLKYQNEASPLSALATAYFQAGKSSIGSKMGGNLLALKVDYKISGIFSAHVGADFLSGDNNSTDGIQTNFKKLYGADHTFNGTMDYWDAPLAQGLRDYYGGLSANVTNKLSLETAYHLFNTDKQLKNEGAQVGRNIGSEIDFIVNYKLNEWTTIQGGWSSYFTTANTLLAKNISSANRTPQWAYIMFTIKPTFFK